MLLRDMGGMSSKELAPKTSSLSSSTPELVLFQQRPWRSLQITADKFKLDVSGREEAIDAFKERFGATFESYDTGMEFELRKPKEDGQFAPFFSVTVRFYSKNPEGKPMVGLNFKSFSWGRTPSYGGSGIDSVSSKKLSDAVSADNYEQALILALRYFLRKDVQRRVAVVPSQLPPNVEEIIAQGSKKQIAIASTILGIIEGKSDETALDGVLKSAPRA